jgi:hypothetical protein
MAKLRDVKLKFNPSQSSDVVGYKLYVQPVPDAPNYTSQSYPLGSPEPDVESGKIVINLTELLSDGSVADGVYNVGVAAVDDGDNISSMDILNNVPLDFVAPDAPTGIEVVRI